ncbi:MAG: KpsF/GutQ family sugar-phosphate isomerase [Pseudomonadota bacterium]
MIDPFDRLDGPALQTETRRRQSRNIRRIGVYASFWDTKLMSEHPHQIAADVVAAEMAGLAALEARLREPGGALAAAVDAAVQKCLALTGRLIVTGMGKSGHIARKIAATFASTGTPASYVHPAEASHGDLGMIAENDLILALSHSGETAELGDVIAHARRFSVGLIAITSGPESALARAADVALLLPPADEAFAGAPAPTTSAAMMLALGDALAVAVLREKGFTQSQFRNFHPGGKLGAALRRATDLMHHTDMPLCRPDDDALKAVSAISAGGFGCVGVVDEEQRLIGMVTDGDLRRHYDVLSDARIASIMTPKPVVVTQDSLAGDVLSIFTQRKITSVFIVDAAGRPIGLVHVHDCLSTGVI